jgi:hypothetical protein
MIKRGWLNVSDPLSLLELRDQLRKFFGLKTDDELTEFLTDPIAHSPIKFRVNNPISGNSPASG